MIHFYSPLFIISSNKTNHQSLLVCYYPFSITQDHLILFLKWTLNIYLAGLDLIFRWIICEKKDWTIFDKTLAHYFFNSTDDVYKVWLAAVSSWIFNMSWEKYTPYAGKESIMLLRWWKYVISNLNRLVHHRFWYWDDRCFINSRLMSRKYAR